MTLLNNFLSSKKIPKSRFYRSLLKHLPVILVLVAVLYPLVWMFAASFRTNFQVFNSLGLLTKNPTLENYPAGWEGGSGIGFSTYFGNSLFISFFAIKLSFNNSFFAKNASLFLVWRSTVHQLNASSM